jgi:ADP-dependent phosphofructokinase/glucokinase
MSMPESLGSIYESIARVWRARFLGAARRSATGKRVLCGYVSTADRCITVSSGLIQAMIDESKVTADEIEAARRAEEQPTSQARTRAEVVLALLWSLEHRGGRISIQHPALMDWLSDLSRRFTHDERLGGAPGSMVNALACGCGEPNVTIFTVSHSEKQASVYPPEIPFLTADAPDVLGTVDAKAYHRFRSDRPHDPDVRNYPLEYQLGEKLSWGPDPADQLTVTYGPDRFICTTPYYHFDADGHVGAGATPAIIERIFQFPGLTHAERDACALAAAAAYPYMVLSGLQGAWKDHRAAILRDLEMLRGKVTIHVELSGARNLPWMQTLISRCISSVGINDDELPAVCQALLGTTQAGSDGEYDSIWAFYQDARALAETLDLPRLYIHTHDADLILRRQPVSDQALSDEILADLFAKERVIDWLRRLKPPDLDAEIRLKRDGLEGLTTYASQVAGLSGKSLLQWLEDSAIIAQRGYFRVEGDYAIAVVPVAWFYGDRPEAIITTGAGDRTSAISFVQSCFTQPRPHELT